MTLISVTVKPEVRAVSFTLRYRAGAGIKQLTIEGDLADRRARPGPRLRTAEFPSINARLDQEEYGAYQATCRLGKFDSTVFGPLTPFLDADNFLFGQDYTGEPRNRSHVKDPALVAAWLDR